MSPEARDFISKLLVADPEQRLSGEQIMAHPWIKGLSTPPEENQGLLEKMRAWNSKRKVNV